MNYKEERTRIARYLRENKYCYKIELDCFDDLIQVGFEVGNERGCTITKETIVYFEARYKDKVNKEKCECSIPMTKIADLILENARNLIIQEISL